MPMLVGWILAMVSPAVLSALLKRVLVLLGLSAVSYVGVGALMSGVTDAITSSYGGMPADVLAVLAIGNVDDAMSVIISAFTVRLSLMGLTATGTLSKIAWRPGTQGSLF